MHSQPKQLNKEETKSQIT